MKQAIAGILVLTFALLAAAQDAAKRKVELPLREAAAAPPVERFDLSRTGIEWHKGIETVLGGEKPILLFQLLGNLDEVYC